jgi:hypothetical protein
LLTLTEKDWINNYHKQVNDKLKPLLSADLHNFLNILTTEI